MIQRRWWISALLVACCLGCSRGGQWPLVPVSGRVTFHGGPCPAKGSVTFMPVEISEGLPRRPGVGQFDVDGAFSVTSFQPGDGLIPGRYEVQITCYSGLPDPSSRDPFGDINFVPNDYHPDELTVAADSGPTVVNYDVPPKKE